MGGNLNFSNLNGGGSSGGNSTMLILVIVCCCCCLSSCAIPLGFYLWDKQFHDWVNGLFGNKK